MHGGDAISQRTLDDDEPSQPPSSYVYPVKSLLTGIQPAPPTQSRPSISRRNSTQSGGLAALQDLLTHQLSSTRKKSVDGPDAIPPHPPPSRSYSMFNPYPSRTATADPSDVSQERPRRVSDPFSTIIQPIDPHSPLSVSHVEGALPSTSIHPSTSEFSTSLSPPKLDPSIPDDSPSDTGPAPPRSLADRALDSYGPKLSQGLTKYALNEEGRSSPTHSIDSHASNISQSGIVHLPPLSSISGSRAGSRGTGSHTHNSSRKYFPSSNSNASSQRMAQVPEAPEEHKLDQASSRFGSDLKSAESSAEGEPGDFITTRYRHETDPNGNHLVIGREGDIRKCEDEVRIQ